MDRMQSHPYLVSIGAGSLAALVFILFWNRDSLVSLTDSAYRGQWKHVTATIFWVGEGATDDNDFIHNSASAWDQHWEEHFGGVDDPDDRCGYQPCEFTPRENPFYIALPYMDVEGRSRKENANMIPWNDSNAAGTMLKDRWVEVSARGKSCFGQWEDVGPFETDDVEYVFGNEGPMNTFGEGAGIDLSPAMRDCLRIDDVADVKWRHVEDGAVPQGPWREIVTE